MFPAATLWETRSIAEIAKELFDEHNPFRRPLDSMIDKLIDCRSAAEVVVRLSRESTDDRDEHDFLHEVVQTYGATLQDATKGVIRDVSELPYPKEVIKSVLQHFIKMGQEDKQMLEAWKIGYLSLADFQPLTEEERDAVSVMGGLSGLSTDEAIQQTVRVGAVYEAVLAKWSAEREDTAKELGMPLR